jgi:hypothetical protein
MLFPFSFMQSQGPIYDVDALAFFARVTAAGGTLTLTEKTAVNTLVVTMKANGTWTPMKAIYPMVGASAAACAQNLKSSSFTGTFTSGWTFASTGLTPNGTSAYMNTTLVPNTAISSQNSNHLSFYSRSSVAANTAGEIGSVDTVPPISYFHSHLYYTGNINYMLLATDTAASVANTTSQGFFNGNRTNSTGVKCFRNGTSLGTASMTSVALNSLSVFISALSINGTASNFSTKECAFATIGDGLTDIQASNFYTAVQAFNQTLNRQVGAQIVSDADAQAYIDRVYTAGGTLTNTEANAVNQLTIDMKAAGIWTPMKAIYPMVGASAAACAQNLKSASFTGTFTSGWTFASTGVTPNGTSAYMNTGLKPSANLTNNNYCLSFYSRTQDQTKPCADLGGYNVAISFWYLGFAKFFNTGPYPTYFATSSNTTTRGLLLGNRQNASSAKLILTTTTLNTMTITDNSLTAYDIYLSATSNLGVATDFSNRECSFSSISDGLTDTQASDFYTAVQAFQTTLSRQV